VGYVISVAGCTRLLDMGSRVENNTVTNILVDFGLIPVFVA
jgi:hypothetical protein